MTRHEDDKVSFSSPDVTVLSVQVPLALAVHVPVTWSAPVTGPDGQPAPAECRSSTPATSRHDDITVQVPTKSPPQGATLGQVPASTVWLVPVLPPLAEAPPPPFVPPLELPPLPVSPPLPERALVPPELTAPPELVTPPEAGAPPLPDLPEESDAEQPNNPIAPIAPPSVARSRVKRNLDLECCTNGLLVWADTT